MHSHATQVILSLSLLLTINSPASLTPPNKQTNEQTMYENLCRPRSKAYSGEQSKLADKRPLELVCMRTAPLSVCVPSTSTIRVRVEFVGIQNRLISNAPGQLSTNEQKPDPKMIPFENSQQNQTISFEDAADRLAISVPTDIIHDELFYPTLNLKEIEAIEAMNIKNSNNTWTNVKKTTEK
jgi:hypothetical protein